MKAITLWRPWAQAIVYGSKRIENREWKPPVWMIGKRFAIHAGKKYDNDGAFWMSDEGLYNPESSDKCSVGILGTAVIEGVVTDSDNPWFVGTYGWVLKEIRKMVEPIPCRGSQGFWDIDYKDCVELDGRRWEEVPR